MISVLHLLWIVPLAASAGAFVLATFSGGDSDPDWYDCDSCPFPRCEEGGCGDC